MSAAALMIQGPGSRVVAHHHQPTAGRRGSSSVSTRAWFKNLTGMGGAATATAGAQSKQTPTKTAVPAASEVVKKFYAAYNSGDIDTIARLMAPNVVYHDMIFEEPFYGRDEVVAYMQKVRDEVPGDLQFIMEDITGDQLKCGITWHVEIGEGTQFPFSRGCSFYTMNDAGQILTARDLVESPSKPGSSSLGALTAVAPLIRKLGPKADPSNLKRLPIAAAAVWALYIGYTAYILVGSSAPGLPAYLTPPETILEVLHESLNFFYVNIGLSALGLSFIPDIPEHPVSEALFNLVAAWGVMFLPVLLTERKCQRVGNTWAWWTAIMFVTNVFFIPFLALRAAPEPLVERPPLPAAGSPSPAVPSFPAASPSGPPAYPSWAKTAALVGLGVGLFSVGWALEGRPALGGDLQDRWLYFQTAFSTNRVFFAFVLDAGLYSVWQATLLKGVGATPLQRFVPFLGLAAHLLQQPVAGGAGAREEASS